MLRPRWNNVEIMSYQPWNDIVQGWKTVALTLRNVDLMLFQRWSPTLYQCCATLKIQFRILLHFQRRISVIWAVIYNIETTLIGRWNVGRVVYMKKFILRNILPATSLKKWNLQVFFKDYAKTFTTPAFTDFFWWVLLRIRLRLVVSNSSGLQKLQKLHSQDI